MTLRKAALLLIGIASSAASLEFEVASVKLNTSATTTMKFPVPTGGRFTATNFTLKALIAFAYHVQSEIQGAPAWLSSERYDINARAPQTDIGRDQYQQMLQALLADRFKLAVHRETKEMLTYSLEHAKNGAKLSEGNDESCVVAPPAPAPGQPSPVACGTFFTGPSSLDARKMSMAQFANTLSIVMGRPVVDKTGLTGAWDIHLEFTPEGTAGLGQPGLNAEPPTADDARPSIFEALQQQLGLRLESKKALSEVLVIDHVERVPTEN